MQDPTTDPTTEDIINSRLDLWTRLLVSVEPTDDPPPVFTLLDADGELGAGVLLGDVTQDDNYAGIRQVARDHNPAWLLLLTPVWKTNYVTGERTEAGSALFVDSRGEVRTWLTDVERGGDSPVATGWEEQEMASIDGALVKAMRDSLTREPAAQNVKMPRNAPCPCGSGSKAKKCCGGAS